MGARGPTDSGTGNTLGDCEDVEAFVAAGNRCKEAAALNKTANSPRRKHSGWRGCCGVCEGARRGDGETSYPQAWKGCLASRGALSCPSLWPPSGGGDDAPAQHSLFPPTTFSPAVNPRYTLCCPRWNTASNPPDRFRRVVKWPDLPRRPAERSRHLRRCPFMRLDRSVNRSRITMSRCPAYLISGSESATFLRKKRSGVVPEGLDGACLSSRGAGLGPTIKA